MRNQTSYAYKTIVKTVIIYMLTVTNSQHGEESFLRS